MARALLDAGRRDRVITIEQLAESAGSSGYPVEGWSTLAAGMPASKEDANPRERKIAEHMSARFDTTWQIGYRLDMDPDLVDVPKTRRIVYAGRVFDIVAARQIGRRAAVELDTIAATVQP
jgi:head-tail adaptor